MYKVTLLKTVTFFGALNIEQKLEEHINEMEKQGLKLVSVSWVYGGKCICVWEKKS